MTQNCEHCEHYFFLKTGNFMINWIRLSPTNILYRNDYPHDLSKYEIKVTLKIPISNLFSEFRKILKYSLGLHSNNPVFQIFPELRKIKNISESNIHKSQKLFVNWEKLKSTA